LKRNQHAVYKMEDTNPPVKWRHGSEKKDDWNRAAKKIWNPSHYCEVEQK